MQLLGIMLWTVHQNRTNTKQCDSPSTAAKHTCRRASLDLNSCKKLVYTIPCNPVATAGAGSESRCKRSHVDWVEVAVGIPNDAQPIGGRGLLKQPPEVASLSIGRDGGYWLGMNKRFVDHGRRQVFCKLQEAFLVSRAVMTFVSRQIHLQKGADCRELCLKGKLNGEALLSRWAVMLFLISQVDVQREQI